MRAKSFSTKLSTWPPLKPSLPNVTKCYSRWKPFVAMTHAYLDKPRPVVTNKDRKVDAMEQLMKDNINTANAAVHVVSSEVEQEVSTAFVILFKNLRTK
jgi:hypothetical protein